MPVRKLNQDTAGVLARVKNGEEFEVTERGVAIAKLVPIKPSPLRHLLATGKLRMPTLTGPLPRPRGPIRTDHESGELLRQMRDEERY